MRILLSFLLTLAGFGIYAQSVVPLRGDTIKIYKAGGSAELVLQNKTQDSLGLLINVGKGKTEFRRAKLLNDSTVVIGLDTLHIKGGGGTGGATDTTSLSARINLKVDSVTLGHDTTYYWNHGTRHFAYKGTITLATLLSVLGYAPLAPTDTISLSSRINQRVLTAANGLTDSAHTALLGGPVYKNTTIDLGTLNRQLWLRTSLKTTEDTVLTSQVIIGDTNTIPTGGINRQYFQNLRSAALVVSKTKTNNNQNVELLTLTTGDIADPNGFSYQNYTDLVGLVQPRMLTFSNATGNIRHGYTHINVMRNGSVTDPGNSAFVFQALNYDSLFANAPSINRGIKRTALLVFENGQRHAFVLDSLSRVKIGDTTAAGSIGALGQLDLFNNGEQYAVYQRDPISKNLFRGKILLNAVGDGATGDYILVWNSTDSTVKKLAIGSNLAASAGALNASGGGGGGNTNTNVGSGHRLAIPGTNQVKTLFCVGCAFDSISNSNALTLTVTSIVPALAAGHIYMGDAAGVTRDTAFVSDYTNMPETRHYIPFRGVSASNSTSANYLAPNVDSAKAYFTATPVGTDGGGWLVLSVSGDSIRVKTPFAVFIGHSIAAAHPGLVGPLEVNGWTPNYPDSFGSITYALDSLTHFPWKPMGIGGQTSTQVRARFMRDAIGLNSNPNDGRTTLTIGAKPSYILLDAFINDYAQNVPDSMSRINYLWFAQVCEEYAIPLIILTSVGDHAITSPTVLRRVQNFNSWLKSGVLGTNVTIVDANEIWNTAEMNNYNPSSLVAPDGIHWTKAGYNTVGVKVFNDAKIPVLSKLVLIHANSVTNPLTNWYRPTSFTIQGVSYTSTNAVVDTFPINFVLQDTIGIKITGSSSVVGATPQTGINTVLGYFDNNPGNQLWYSKKKHFTSPHTSDLVGSTLNITANSYTNGMQLFNLWSNDGTYNFFQVVGNPGGSTTYVNGGTTPTAYNGAKFNVTGQIGSSGGFYSTATTHQFGSFQVFGTAPASGSGTGINLVSGTMLFQNNNLANTNGFSFSGFNKTPTVTLSNLNIGALHSDHGIGSVTGHDDTVSMALFNQTYNISTFANQRHNNLIGGITLQPVLTNVGAEPINGYRNDAGVNNFNTAYKGIGPLAGRSIFGGQPNQLGSGLLDMASTKWALTLNRMTTAQRDSLGAVSSLVVSNQGTGYTGTPPNITFSGGTGSGARAYAFISGANTLNVVLSDGGYQYKPATGVTANIVGGTGSGGVLTAVVSLDKGTVIYNTTVDSVQAWNGTAWVNLGGGGSPGGGITSINGLTGSTQTFATGTSGTDFNIGSTGTAHTFNIPDAGASARGLVTTGTQTFAGVKTFSSSPVVPTATAHDSSGNAASTKYVDQAAKNAVDQAAPDTQRIYRSNDSVYLCIKPAGGGGEACSFQYRDTLLSGTYAPAISASTNVTSPVLDSATWTRSGSIVTLRVAGTFTPTTTGYVSVEFDAPVASVSWNSGARAAQGTGSWVGAVAAAGCPMVAAFSSSTKIYIRGNAPNTNIGTFSAVIQYNTK